jgi:hypothetical protein
MRTSIVLVLGFLGAGCQSTPTTFTTGGPEVMAERGRPYQFSFDDAAGPLPAAMSNVLGQWTRSPDATAPSGPNVLQQGGQFSNPDYPRVLVNELTFQDATVSVRCRMDAGSIDRACGLMFRAQDSDNYYVTRANALESNIRFYRVVAGSRMQLASANKEVTSGAWHLLEATTAGDEITVRWDGEQVMRSRDATFAKGKIGLWTKADSVTAFDDLEATEN